MNILSKALDKPLGNAHNDLIRQYREELNYYCQNTLNLKTLKKLYGTPN